MNIRKYQSSDLAACLKIFDSNIPKYFADQERLLFVNYLGQLSTNTYWVIEKDNTVIACGGYGVRDGEGRMHWGMVDQSMHRQGIGSHFFRFRLAKLIEMPEVKFIGLDTSQHTPGFFKQFGFRETKVTPEYYGPGLHRHDMQWDLPQDNETRLELIQNLLKN